MVKSRLQEGNGRGEIGDSMSRKHGGAWTSPRVIWLMTRQLNLAMEKAPKRMSTVGSHKIISQTGSASVQVSSSMPKYGTRRLWKQYIYAKALSRMAQVWLNCSVSLFTWSTYSICIWGLVSDVCLWLQQGKDICWIDIMSSISRSNPFNWEWNAPLGIPWGKVL